MIFDFIQDTYPNSCVPDFDLDKIGKICKTLKIGTLPKDILNLNNIPEVAIAKPSIEFELKLKFHTFEELAAETDSKQPPIAWIWSLDEAKKKKFDHAVVIRGIENHRVYYNDPVFGELNVPVEDFLSRWDDEYRVLVKVKIGQKKEKKLMEFMEPFNKDQQQITTKEGSKVGNES
jgi:hypothetical protein